MPAAAVSTTNEQDLDTLQRRERLALAVKQAREQEEKQSAAITELGETLRDAVASGQDVPKTIAELANRLKQLTHGRDQAERALAKFDRLHESNEVIQARIEQREKEEAAQREEEARQTFIDNRRRAIPLITELLKLDDEIKDLPARFNEGGWIRDSFRAVGGLKKSLIKVEKKVNLHGGVESETTTEPTSEAIMAEFGRVIEGLTPLDMRANPHWWFR